VRPSFSSGAAPWDCRARVIRRSDSTSVRATQPKAPPPPDYAHDSPQWSAGPQKHWRRRVHCRNGAPRVNLSAKENLPFRGSSRMQIPTSTSNLETRVARHRSDARSRRTRLTANLAVSLNRYDSIRRKPSSLKPLRISAPLNSRFKGNGWTCHHLFCADCFLQFFKLILNDRYMMHRLRTAAFTSVLLAIVGGHSALAGLVVGDTVATSFISGGWGLTLTLSPASTQIIGSGVEATYTGSHNYFLGPGSATYILDFFNDSSDRSFMDLTAVFSTSPSTAPTIGANFVIDSLDFGPGYRLASVSPVTGTSFPGSVTPTSFTISTGGIVISPLPQTIRVELVTVAVPEPATGLSVGLLGAAVLLFWRRR